VIARELHDPETPKINLKGGGHECPPHTLTSRPGGCPSTGVTCSFCWRRITILAMRFSSKSVAALTLCGVALSPCFAQPQIQDAPSSGANTQVQNNQVQNEYVQNEQVQNEQVQNERVQHEQVRRENIRRRPAPVALNPDDGLSVIAAALDSRVQATRQRDCSHLVHAIYLRAGFPYPYASSSDLYDGADNFQRVTRPQPGDLVVWPGHVGIVVNPAQRVFFSRLRHGPGVDAYDAQYWKQRGQLRFYRYIKGSPARVAATRLVR
jgi:cell wall-associated NlpC family hydrolase